MPEERFRLIVEQDTRQAVAANTRLEAQMGRTTAAGAAMGRMFIWLGGVAAIGGFAKKLVTTGMEFQTLENRLITFTGSAAVAREEMERFARISTQTPATIQQVTEAAIGLRARGFDPTSESIKTLADIAAASGKDIVTAMQAVTQAGFGEAEMLKQFGIVMTQQGDRATIKYDDLTRVVKKDSKEIVNALLEIGRVKFAGAAERESKTLAGSLSTLRGNVDLLTNSIAGSSGLIENLGTLTRSLNELAGNAGFLKMISVVSEAATKLTTFNILMKLLESRERLLQGETDETTAALKKLAGAFDSGGGDVDKYRSKIDALIRSLGEWQTAAQAVESQALRIFEATTGPTESIATSPTGFLPTDNQIAVFGSRVTQVLTDAGITWMDWLKAAWKDLGDFILAILTNAGLRAGDALVDALLSGDASGLESAFTDIGRDMGGQIGEGIGMWFGGPGGAILGNILGQLIGNSIGKVVGGVVTSILSVLGLTKDPHHIRGSFSVGPGADVPGSNTNLAGQFFSGVGGTPEAQSIGNQMLSQIEEIFTTIQDAIGATLNLTQTMIVQVRRDGSAILEIVTNNVRQIIGVFGTVQEAMEAGIAQLLSTALVNSEHVLAQAFEEVLGRAAEAGIDATLQQIQTLASVYEGLSNLLRPQDSVLAQIEEYRRQLEALGLTAEAAAPLLAMAAQAEQERLRQLELAARQVEAGIFGGIVGILESMGAAEENARLIARFKQMEFQLTILELRERIRSALYLGQITLMQAQAWAGILDQADTFGRRLTNFMARAADSSRDIADTLGEASDDFGDDFESAVFGQNVFESAADWWASQVQQIQGFIDNFAGVGLNRNPLEQLQATWNQFLAEFGWIGVDHPRFQQSQAAFLAAWERLVDQMKDKLAGFIEGLTGTFGQATPLELLASAQSSFDDLLAAALGGDMDAFNQLEGAAQSLLDLAAGIFGTSTGDFAAIFDQVTSGLQAALGATFEPVLSGTEQQTAALMTPLTSIASTNVSIDDKMDTLTDAVNNLGASGSFGAAPGF